MNSFINNTHGISDGAAGAVDAENNWWGCNFGPGGTGAGCSGTPDDVFNNGSGTVDADPWIVLAVSASPNPIPASGSSTVTADMTDNSASTDTTAVGLLPQMPVGWSATQGTMSPTNGTITSDLATSTFTSTSNSSGTGCAMVTGQLICTNITVIAPTPTPTPAPVTVVVKPSAMNGWYFWDDFNDRLEVQEHWSRDQSPRRSGREALNWGRSAASAGQRSQAVIATDAYSGTPIANFTNLSY